MKLHRYPQQRPKVRVFRVLLALCVLIGLCYAGWKLMESESPEIRDDSQALERAAPLPTEQEYPQGALPEKGAFDSLVVEKGKRRLFAYSNGVLVRVYAIALGTNPVGNKEAAGDGKTPEGQYSISAKQETSVYHKALLISYPNAEDLARKKSPEIPASGSIQIHGLPEQYAFLGITHRASDWTNGCIAVSNEEMDELFARVKAGIPITIQP